MAQRILGMGDVLSLVERAQQQFDEDEAKALENKIRKNQFTSTTSSTSSRRFARWAR